MGWECSDVVRFDLGPLFEGQMRTAKLKSAYNLLLVLEVFNVKPSYRMWSDLTLGPCFKVKRG